MKSWKTRSWWKRRGDLHHRELWWRNQPSFAPSIFPTRLPQLENSLSVGQNVLDPWYSLTTKLGNGFQAQSLQNLNVLEKLRWCTNSRYQARSWDCRRKLPKKTLKKSVWDLNIGLPVKQLSGGQSNGSLSHALSDPMPFSSIDNSAPRRSSLGKCLKSCRTWQEGLTMIVVTLKWNLPAMSLAGSSSDKVSPLSRRSQKEICQSKEERTKEFPSNASYINLSKQFVLPVWKRPFLISLLLLRHRKKPEGKLSGFQLNNKLIFNFWWFLSW